MAGDGFVLGVDLDGVVADFYGRLRVIAAEWLGRSVEELSMDGSDISQWGIGEGQDDYERLHRFALTERNLFSTMDPIPGAPQALRGLSRKGVRIRIVTHRLVFKRLHRQSVMQTVKWLDHHDIPYWDLCFLGEKSAVDADCFVDDTPEQVERLAQAGKHVIVYTNFTNTNFDFTHARFSGMEGKLSRASNWDEVVAQVIGLADGPADAGRVL
ncbi:MAG: 5'-nucleotidase [Actinobacteria bacterium]|nr:5'-nucleotidase [Actinomycetota bacterium]MCL5446242.1 5'-nucleotidase [Actinomycetota bacterium]